MNSKEIVSKLSLDEKIALLGGKDFWHTQEILSENLTSIEVSDGPVGLRKQKQHFDHLGFFGSEPATACVSGPALSSSFDKKLYRNVGKMLGNEAKVLDVDLLLGPAVNIIKSPLCGRNFEYFSEDPVLAGETAAAFIEGVQSTGVGACIKHFAVNNQETEREYIDARVDERALREIYLKVFEIAIKKSQPWAVMSSLNKVNGIYASESSYLLTDILREEWKFNGIVMSDWWGINNRVQAVKAGLDLEMPYSDGVGSKKLKQAYQAGKLTEEEIDSCCMRMVELLQKNQSMKYLKLADTNTFDIEKHHQLAKQQALGGIVLLKNEEAILPLSPTQKIAVFGTMAKQPRFRLEGSALVNPTKFDVPLDEISKISKNSVDYMADFQTEAEIEQAQKIAEQSEVAICFVGLEQGMEAEGHDRKNLLLPAKHNQMIAALAKVQPNLIVVISSGAQVEMPWIHQVKGVFECFLAGQAMGSAISELLYGVTNPSGKLSITFPKKLANVFDYTTFPGNKQFNDYQEGIFVGYRGYEIHEITPLFPFGFGLSYTHFNFLNITFDEMNLKVFVTIKNTGDCYGGEVVQLYVGSKAGRQIRPVKELKHFEKIFLHPNEEKTIEFSLKNDDFSYYLEELEDWYIENGQYTLFVGTSSEDIVQEIMIEVASSVELPQKLSGWSEVERLKETHVGRQALEEMRKLIQTNYCEDSLKELFDKNEFGELKIRFLILQTQTVINNDLIEGYLYRCNQELIEIYREKTSKEKLEIYIKKIGEKINA